MRWNRALTARACAIRGTLTSHRTTGMSSQRMDSRRGKPAPSRPRVVLTHGDDKARNALARAIAERHGIEAGLPDLFDLIEDGPAAAVAANRWSGRAGC